MSTLSTNAYYERNLDDFDEDQFYFENDPDALSELYELPDKQMSEEYFRELDEINKPAKPKRNPRRGRPITHKGIFQIIHNESRTVFDTVTDLTQWSKDHFKEFGYKQYQSLYRNLCDNLKRQDDGKKIYKRKFTINKIR